MTQKNTPQDPSVTLRDVWDELEKIGFKRDMRRVVAGVRGDWSIYVGYGSYTVRLRLFRNDEFKGMLDISTREGNPALVRTIAAQIDRKARPITSKKQRKVKK